MDSSLAGQISRLIDDPRLGVDAYDKSSVHHDGEVATLIIKSPEALQQVLWAPGELGVARAYVSGALDLEGDLYAALESIADVGKRVKQRAGRISALRLASRAGITRPPIPKEEARLRGKQHTKSRDAAAISHHYDVSNAFYRLVLGPSMTYSCAVFPSPDTTLEDAQATKYDLICAKLDLQPGQRLLDVGCGWGSMVRHAVKHYGVTAVGVTLSKEQAAWGRDAVAGDGLSDQIDIRIQDYRDIPDGPYDAISSIGMFEHVGYAQLGVYFRKLYELVKPGGRVLNHGISKPSGESGISSPFIQRYVFPDGELHEVGRVVSAMQESGLEARHVESLREHYALTLRHWVANLEANWDIAVAEVGEARARIWRLYMAASAVGFESNGIQIHHVLADRADSGNSGMPLRPTW